MNTIGKLAKKLSINVETIRFYERKGLIAQPEKPSSGYRLYPESTERVLRFVIKAKMLGFTLNEIQSLLSLSDMPCDEMEQITKAKLKIVEEKMKHLERLKTGLTEVLSSCHANPDKTKCPVINALYEG